GWEDTEIARLAIARYVEGLEGADTLLLACTHYPLLERTFREVVPPHVHVLDPSPAVAIALEDWLVRHPGFVAPGAGHLRVLCTGEPATFQRHGERMLGAPLPAVQHVALVDGRLAHRERVEIPTGQLVRPSGLPPPR
ncbi:MAG: glutamate racemase, partial [Deltaproteobacteria bacterium]